ncbi:hypothetical protein DFH29DRAFT_1083730 [Suillus ampliporus]|nr:hypothetical protein DFH29DRAFT_1083730 [Suillus ampliporus]
MKAFGKKRMEILLREIHALSFSRSHVPPVNVKEPDRGLPYIHGLPVELLQQIFLLIVNDVPDCPSIFSFGETTISVDVASPPLILTRVCRLWRVVAYSTTGVWSRIQVGLPGRVQPLKSFLPDLLQCWLARSGSRPLTLRIVDKRQFYYRVCGKHPWQRPSEVNSQLLDILLSESKRWETVVMLPVEDWSQNFDAPQLRSLECCLSNLRRFNAPNLSRLYIIASRPCHPNQRAGYS